MYDVVIIGGNAAGMSAASRITKLRPHWKFVVIEKENFISYGACGLPYFLSGVIKNLDSIFALTPEKAKRERNIEVMLKTEAVEIDMSRNTLKVYSHEEQTEKELSFKKLIIATGASPFVPPVDGINNSRTFTLRTPTDAVRIKEFIKNTNPKKVTIIGGGPLGLEMAEAFSALNLKVSIIEMENQLLPQIDPEISSVIEEEVLNNNVEIKTGEKLTGVESGGSGLKIYTDKGEYETDMLFLAIGVRPNSKIASSVGIKLGPAGAIDVDETMKTSQEGVFAAGDCADAIHVVSGEKVYIPLGTTANKQGRIAGINSAEGTAKFRGVAGTFAVKVFTMEVASTGLSEKRAKERFEVDSVTIKGRSRAGYYPGGSPLFIKLTFEKNTGKLLGAQIAGREGVAKRIDIFATALFNKMSVEDVYNLDLSYAPPFAPVWDPVLIAAENALKKVRQ